MTKRAAAIQFKPLGNRVLVRRLEEKEQKRGGIILPDTAKKKPELTEVVAVGPGKKTQEGQNSIIDILPAITPPAEMIRQLGESLRTAWQLLAAA